MSNMPPTAFILSGQARTFARCLASQHWHVYRHYPNKTFYVSVADDADADSMDLLSAKYPDAKVFIEKVKQPDLKEPDAKLADHAPYAISSPIQAILKQLWHLSRAWKFAQESGLQPYSEARQTIFRIRPDLHFQGYFHNEPEVVNPRLMPNQGYAETPFWGRYGGCNDRFARFYGHDAAKAYFEAWDCLPSILGEGCPLHPESIILAALKMHSIPHFPVLDAEFAALRPDGKLIPMVVLPGEYAAFTAYLISLRQ